MVDQDSLTLESWYFLENRIVKKTIPQHGYFIPISSHQLIGDSKKKNTETFHWVYLDTRSGIVKEIKSESLPAFYYPIVAKLSPDGQTIAVGTEEATVILMDLESYSIKNILRHEDSYVGENPARIFALSFSSDNTKLASGSENGETIVWDLNSNTKIAYLKGQNGSATAVAFSPDNKRLATGSLGNPIIIWNIQSNEKIAKLHVGIPGCIRDIAFTDDGKKLTYFSVTRQFGWHPTPSFGIFDLNRLEIESNTFAFSAERYATFFPDKKIITGFFDKNFFLNTTHGF